MNTLVLSDLKTGESARIVSINAETLLRDRLLDMGLTPKTIVTLRKIAPMGDPIEINLRGYSLTLRKRDASFIEVERV